MNCPLALLDGLALLRAANLLPPSSPLLAPAPFPLQFAAAPQLDSVTFLLPTDTALDAFAARFNGSTLEVGMQVEQDAWCTCCAGLHLQARLLPLHAPYPPARRLCWPARKRCRRWPPTMYWKTASREQTTRLMFV